MLNDTISNRTIYCRDNLDVLEKINSQSIDLIYLDPPFNKKKTFAAPIGSSAEGAEFSDIFRKEDVKDEWLQTIKEDYEDIHTLLRAVHNLEGKQSYNFCYLAYMSIRLIEMHRILKDTGSIYLHCDQTMSHYLKLLLDCIFGEKNFRNEITWQRWNAHPACNNGFDRITDTILFYVKTDKTTTNNLYIKYKDYAEKAFNQTEKETGRKFQVRSLEKKSHFKYEGEERKIDDKIYKTNIGWVWSQKTFDERIQANPYVIYITKSCKVNYKIYEDEWKGIVIPDIWTDISGVTMKKIEKVGYPTQKPLALLERIIKASSSEGDIVLDPFCGCATTCVAAEKLNRQWIGIDVSHKAYELVRQRLKKEVEEKRDLFDPEKDVYYSTSPPRRTDLGVDYREKKYVYIISHPKYPGEYKVGIAKRLEKQVD